MEDIGLFKQGWGWFQSQKHMYSRMRVGVSSFRDKTVFLIDRHWPMVCRGSVKLWRFVLMVLMQWRDCVNRGFRSVIGFGSAALLMIMWSCFISLTSIQCVVYVLLSMGAAGIAVRYLGYTPGLFIVGLFGILILWICGNFWITGSMFIVGGYLFSLNHARLVVLMATAYSLYCVKVRAGWLGVFLSINLAFFSNDVLSYLLQVCDNESEDIPFEEQKTSEPVTEDEFSGDSEFSVPTDEAENLHSCKSSSSASATSAFLNIQKNSSTTRVIKADTSSLDEMKRIINSLDHYEVLGVCRSSILTSTFLKREYHKMAMLVHPDKNMGSSLAGESFKKLQCAYEATDVTLHWQSVKVMIFQVLSDAQRKREYDDQLRKEECRSVHPKSHGSSHQDGADYQSEESRRIQCTKCGNSHIWICTNRTKAKARWCQDCCQYHSAKDGDGWVEYKCLMVTGRAQKVEIPRAFVCAESKIFDVSEWAICQGMTCRPNTHRPSFHVNMVGLENLAQRSNSSRFPWDLDAKMMEEDVEFEVWLQQALASGLFSETSKRRKTWSPFKLPQKKRQWRKSP
ncbi:hypothetical protein IFM89_017628 [Coptis chinensis]|uniref:J domain-containing protein n=1 Tax=Coptis chinensis TaxID=261450 RepID=A0A835GY19_9MAGN|nr:hypothetical protein IFM89_017628 [Coptis chinensis]